MKQFGVQIGCVLGLSSPLVAQVAVPKTNPIPVYVQFMPWFQTPYTLGAGNWGFHWKMNDRNPNIIDSDGEREIASNYYPLIGPYDSSDPYVIEDQMLLMKVSGITGAIVDWYGVQGSNGDIASLLSASNKIVAATQTYGLQVGVTLEDRFSTSTSEVSANLNYLASNYYTQSNYMTVGASKTPVVTLFGPETYTEPSQWTTIMSGVTKKPVLVPLQYQASQVGSPATGEMGWVYENPGSNNYSTVLGSFLSSEAGKFTNSLGVAYPGYNDYYAQGDDGPGSGFVIPESNGATLSQTLALNQTYSGNIPLGIQIATWNDYGEGTQIEPTVQDGFTDLEEIQKFTGVPYGLSQLQLVYDLFLAREDYLSNATEEAMLSTAANDINNLDFNDAQTIIDQALGIPEPAALPALACIFLLMRRHRSKAPAASTPART
jgi:hypothetical protein